MIEIREDMKRSLDTYAKTGLMPGGFLTAVLENNLSEALGRADLDNRHNIFNIVSYVYNEMPSVCWGSAENVDRWSKGFTPDGVNE